MPLPVFLVFSTTWQIKERTIFGRNERIVGENVSDGESTAATSIYEGEALLPELRLYLCKVISPIDPMLFNTPFNWL